MSENDEQISSRFICIWLDNQLIRDEDYTETFNQIRALATDFKSFNNCDECLDFLTDIYQQRIILIISYFLAKRIIHFIHDYEQIDVIYIFTTKKLSDDQSWIENFRKIKSIFENMKLMPNRFLEDTKEKEDQSIAISILSSSDVYSSDINRQDPSFMYFQLIKDILLNDHLAESEEDTKQEMIKYCRQTYMDNPNAIVILDEFEQSYIPELAIYWYTRESFLYQMLNRALWTPQPDVLYKLRYFVRHLYLQILTEAKQQHDQLKEMILYRGQSMNKEQFEKLKRNIGGFLSFNNFLSTTLQERIARNFLIGSEIGVLFQIHIDHKIRKFPMINIELISYLHADQNEQEFIFAMGSLFRIQTIEQHKYFYRVHLTLTDETDQQLAKYFQRTREKTRTSHSFLSLLRLMDELSLYGSVDRFAEIFREDFPVDTNPKLIAAIHHMFGSIYHSREQYKNALYHYHESLKIYKDFLSPDDPQLTPSYNNIGTVYLAQADYNKALEYQKLALECQMKSESPDPSALTIYNNNLAKIYTRQKKYKEALEHHQRALEIQKQFLVEDDSSIAETYQYISQVYFQMNDILQGAFYYQQATSLQEKASQSNPDASVEYSIKNGNICSTLEQYEQAIEHFKHALQIQQQYLLPTNPALATTYNHIARAYYKQKKYEESLSHYIKALEIEKSALSDDHPSIATSYHNISTAYVGLSRWSEALQYALNAVEQLKKRFDADGSTLADFVNHVGYIYHQQSLYQDALIYFEEALELYRAQGMEDDASIVSLFYQMGTAYCKLKRYDQALDFYKKTLNIELVTLPDDAETIATTYSSLSDAYVGLNRYNEAIVTTEQAIKQLLKTLTVYHPQVLQQQMKLEMIKNKRVT